MVLGYTEHVLFLVIRTSWINFPIFNMTKTRTFLSPLRAGSYLYMCMMRMIVLVLVLAAGNVQAQGITLNLKDADINALIDTVSKNTGKNFIVDPKVKGKVTVISARPMDREELYQVFLSILQVHGFTAVPSGKVTKIVPDANAKQDRIPTASNDQPGSGDELVTRVVQVDNVASNQLVPILRPLIPQHGHLAAYARTNVLIITDRAANIDRLVKIIRRIDRAGNEDIEIIPLQHASAGEVVRILTSLQQKHLKAGVQDDQPTFVADDRTNSILMTADRATRLRLRAIITHLDTPIESGGNTQVIYLKYAKAKDLASVLTGVSENLKKDGKTGKPAVQGDSINIQADENTNALVITAAPAVMRSIQAVIRQLDVRRAQVLVEAVIAEVSSTKAAELGVQWRTSDNFGTTFSGTSSGSIDSFPGNPVSLGVGLSLGYYRDNNLHMLLRALATDNNTNVLSTPTLLTLDNEEAVIVVGENVPFITGQFTNNTTSPDNPFQTIERHDVGIVLKVKPQINEGDAVKLDIEQEVSSVKSGSGSELITNKRSIRTSVLVDDSTMIVLGGLIKDDLEENTQKVPLLGDIPLVGALFRNKRTDAIKTNLMVFIRPQIVRDARDSVVKTHDKYNFIRAMQLDAGKEGVSLMPGASAPLLPELNKVFQDKPLYEDANKPSATPQP